MRLTARPKPTGHVRPGAILAATIASDTLPGEPAEFTLDRGDGHTLRGLWDRIDPPMEGDHAAALFDDDGNAWLLIWPAT